MVVTEKIKARKIYFAIASVFILIYLTVFYAFGIEDSSKGLPLIAITRVFFLMIFILIILHNKSILRLAFNYENTYIKLVILFLTYQLFQVLFNSSPFSGLAKYLYFFSLILVGVFIDFDNIYFKINKSNNFTIVLFIIILGFYVLYMFEHPFATSFRATRIDILNWNNNENAGFFATVLPFIVFTLRNQKKLLFSFLTFFLYIFIFYNGSIAAIISTLIILVTYGFLSSRNKKLFGIFYFIVFFMVIYGVLSQLGKFDTIFSGGLNNVLSGRTQEGNLAGRIGGIWMPVLTYVSEHNFLFGFGSNSWAEVSSKAGTYWLKESGSANIYVFRDAHNFFLVAFVEGGIINIFFILSFFILGIRSSLFAIRESIGEYDKKYAITIFCSWLGLLTWCMMYNAWYSGGWYFFSLLMILSLIMKNHVKRSIRISAK